MAAPRPSSVSLFGEEADDDSFWLKLMSECLENPVTKLPTGKKLLVLGDNEAEKSNLITKLQGFNATESTGGIRKGNGLEFRYLTVKDEYCDNQTKLSVWILDGDPFYKPLLKYALDESSLDSTTVLLVASMTKPWDLLDTINTWTDILRSHIEDLDLPEGELEVRKAKVLERYREYIEPGLSIYGSLAADNTRELPVNIGIELVVVITKTEYMRELQTEFGYEEEHFDFIQLSLREFCLFHGAALFYVSVKEEKNCDLLLKYLLHKIYSFPFRLPAVLVERDSILVPAGWDNKNKIRFLSETLSTIPSSMPYEDVVFKPTRLMDTGRAAAEIVARRDQDFLADMMAALERQAAEERIPESAKDNSSMTATVVQRNVARRMTRPPPNRSPQKKAEAKLVSGEGDNTLSNFFHSLLNRRTSAPVDRPLGLGGGRTMASKHNITRNNNISTPESSIQNKGALNSHDSNEQNSPRIRKTSEESSENDSESSCSSSKLKSTAHLSLDQEDKEGHHLPEYFLSNPGAAAGSCNPDCSFKTQSSSSLDMEEDDFSPPLDRVSSTFNPPLRLLLEKSGKPSQKELANGEVKDPVQLLKTVSDSNREVKEPVQLLNTVSDSIGEVKDPVQLLNTVGDSNGEVKEPVQLLNTVSDSIGEVKDPVQLLNTVGDSNGEVKDPVQLLNTVSDSNGEVKDPVQLLNTVGDSNEEVKDPVQLLNTVGDSKSEESSKVDTSSISFGDLGNLEESVMPTKPLKMNGHDHTDSVVDGV